MKTGKPKSTEFSVSFKENADDITLKTYLGKLKCTYLENLSSALRKAEVIKLEKQEYCEEQIRLMFIQYRGMKLLKQQDYYWIYFCEWQIN